MTRAARRHPQTPEPARAAPPAGAAAPGTSTPGTSTTGTTSAETSAAGTGSTDSGSGSGSTGATGTGTGTTGTGTTNTAWTRAVLPLCLLAILDTEKQSYGYALLNHLATAGLHGVKAATLYPALTRLEEDGSVEIEWGAGEGGPGRKYYRITDAGRARLHHDRTAWASFTHSVATLTGTTAPGTPGEPDGPGEPAAPGTARPAAHAGEPGNSI